MKITIIGSGYVGLVTGACLAEMGNQVLCFDVDPRKIELLESGGLPIHEPGLLEIVLANRLAGRLTFTTDPEVAGRHGTIQFIAVGTPQDEDGSADLQYVLAAAASIGRHMDGYRVVVDKSTVPVGTGDLVHEAIAAELSRRNADLPFSVVSNPEFLKEGAAVADFMRPDRIVIGCHDERAGKLMRSLYEPFMREHDGILMMDMRSAELTKYAANAMLASRISFMNEMALIAEGLGADIELVRKGIGSDPRIGSHFLYAGCGYGGSCFPKDVKALIRTAAEVGVKPHVVVAIDEVNERQKRVLVQKVLSRFGGDLKGKTFALWGLAFKPNTDDMRDAPSRVIVNELIALGASIKAYDPVAMPEARRIFADQREISFAGSALDAIRGADALVIVTEWMEFRTPDFSVIKTALREPVIFDGRNLYSPDDLRAFGIEYFGIGRNAIAKRHQSP